MMTSSSASARMIFASERARSGRAAGRGKACLETKRVSGYACRRRDTRARAKDKSKGGSNEAIDELGKARALRSVASKRARRNWVKVRIFRVIAIRKSSRHSRMM